MSAAGSAVIRIAAALVLEADGRCLLVRKRGTESLMQPGGKIDAGEAPEAALLRELHEELDPTGTPRIVGFLGRFSAPAVNEPGRIVEAMLYEVDGLAEVRPRAEIEEIVRIDPAAPPDRPIAPLTRDHVLPLARMRLGGGSGSGK